jgi:hypothetical protein
VGGHQLEWPETPHLYQQGAGDLLPVVVPQHDSRGLPTIGCTFVNPLGTLVVRRPGLLSGCRGEDVLGKFSRPVSNFNCFVF